LAYHRPQHAAEGALTVGQGSDRLDRERLTKQRTVASAASVHGITRPACV
jgi:hypothetical protein